MGLFMSNKYARIWSPSPGHWQYSRVTVSLALVSPLDSESPSIRVPCRVTVMWHWHMRPRFHDPWNLKHPGVRTTLPTSEDHSTAAMLLVRGTPNPLARQTWDERRGSASILR